MDIQLVYIPNPPDLGTFDIAMNGADLLTGNDLQSAILISLFTNRLAEADDPLPDPNGDRQGWWGDDFANVDGDLIGSRLYLLNREKQTNETLVRAKEYVEEALQWLLDDLVVDTLNVNVAYVQQGFLGIQVQCVDGKGVSSQYSFVWDQIAN